jgi:hypothetical protein
MPRYYFDTSDEAVGAGGEATLVDEAGLSFSSFDAARAAALEALVEMARDSLRTDGHAVRILIRDSQGKRLLRARLMLEVESASEEGAA